MAAYRNANQFTVLKPKQQITRSEMVKYQGFVANSKQSENAIYHRKYPKIRFKK